MKFVNRILKTLRSHGKATVGLCVLAAILTYVMAQKASLIYGAVLLFIYALGRGVPIILAGTFAGVLKSFRSLGRWTEWMEKISGVIIIAVGFYFLWTA